MIIEKVNKKKKIVDKKNHTTDRKKNQRKSGDTNERKNDYSVSHYTKNNLETIFYFLTLSTADIFLNSY